MPSRFFNLASSLPNFIYTLSPNEVTVAWDDLPDYLATFQGPTATAARPPKLLKIDLTYTTARAQGHGPGVAVDILPLILLRQRYPRMAVECFHRQVGIGTNLMARGDCDEIIRILNLKNAKWLEFMRTSLDRIEVHRLGKYCGYINLVLKPGREPEGFVEADKRDGVQLASFPYLKEMKFLETPTDWFDVFMIVAEEEEAKC